jgi:hypothetical protein
MSNFESRDVARFRALWICGILLVTAPVAQAGGAGESWTESRAARVVTRDAAVRVPARQRTALEHELRQSFALYRALELEAELEGEVFAAAIYHHLAFRYTHELSKMLNGLEVEAADCAGLGARVQRDRYRRFRCLVTSEPLTIPSATLVSSGAGKVPAVIEGAPRIVGPFRTRLLVRVTGKSTASYRQLI